MTGFIIFAALLGAFIYAISGEDAMTGFIIFAALLGAFIYVIDRWDQTL